jgi:hypothetical protein
MLGTHAVDTVRVRDAAVSREGAVVLVGEGVATPGALAGSASGLAATSGGLDDSACGLAAI